MRDIHDITIIGGGPTGLFASFYAGLRGVSTRIIDSLPELGGQLVALYPEKYIFDVGGLPKILAKDLARDLIEQGLQFGPDVVLDEEVREIHAENGDYRIVGARDTYRSRTIVISGGKGAFEPQALDVPGYDRFLGHGVFHAVRDPDMFRGRQVVIVGGGDSALDWALALKGKAESVLLVHRRDGWRAHERSIELLFAARETGEVDVRTFHEVRRIDGDEGVQSVTIFDNRSDEEAIVPSDCVLALLGFKPDVGPIKNWGLALDRNRIVVNQLMETNLPGVYAAGDVVQYPGKLDLIATGFSEAAIAVNNAVHFMDPSARVAPGHSTNLKIFKGK